MAQRLGTDFRHLRVTIPFGFQLRTSLRLDSRQLQLFGQDLGELVHRQIDFQDVAARRISCLPGAVFVNIAWRQRSAGFALALSHASHIPAAEAEVRHFDLRDRNADKIFPLFPDQLALRDVLLQVLLDLSPDNLPEPEVILFDIENHNSNFGFRIADFGFEESAKAGSLNPKSEIRNPKLPLIPSRLRARICSPRSSARRWRRRRNSRSS